jgi:cytochrome oxidase assembly protein ShyY1
MTRKLPLVPTILVAAAVAVMIGLGVWQLQKAPKKEALIEQYRAALKMPPIAYPTIPVTGNLPLYRYATAMCLRPVSRRAMAGPNRSGETGYVHIVGCSTGAEGPGLSVQVGWSLDPNAKFEWRGGPVSGIIVPDDRTAMRLIAATPAAGLAPNAAPQPGVSVTPERHRGYALTWFALAIAAVVVYLLALRQRWNKEQKG